MWLNPKMKIWGIVGSVQEDNSVLKPSPSHIEMKNHRPSTNHVATADGEWVIDNSIAFIKARVAAYPSIQDQLDMQYWDSVNGTTVWADTIAAIKTANPFKINFNN
jgi:hypothetical protein